MATRLTSGPDGLMTISRNAVFYNPATLGHRITAAIFGTSSLAYGSYLGICAKNIYDKYDDSLAARIQHSDEFGWAEIESMSASVFIPLGVMLLLFAISKYSTVRSEGSVHEHYRRVE